MVTDYTLKKMFFIEGLMRHLFSDLLNVFALLVHHFKPQIIQ